ncbi:coiled-coil domain-containing protein [Wolbachia endosymbiont (group B) of Erebia ligea]|uniref:hypothetical protein n=1 Tax=Wolbachia endosymbiont (group B) of Erebia ligea TaxID=2954010 RepID=UPI0021F8805A|nr:hypothetical protein [Wolbachia endosymbiont (group B) of Erebia ligea]
MLKENLFIAENQGLDIDEQKKNDILSFIESCNNFQDFIKKLEEENLIWYFIGPLRKDKDIKKQINLKWENEFQKFEQLINETHRKFEESLPGENFLVYTTKDNDFKIRFENKEKPIEISALLRASDEGKVYNLSLGKDSQITATKKGSERHYNFAGSSSCKMTINWQAKDSKGNNINCSMTVEVNSKGIKRVTAEPKFGDLIFKDLESEETKKKILELVEQNTEVFINGKTLHQAFNEMGKSVNNQQTPAEETFTKDSLQSATPSSSGYSSLSTPSSRRSSLSISSEFNGEDETFESNTFDEEENKQEGNELQDRIGELEEENTYLKEQSAKLKKHNTRITEEGDEELNKLTKEKQDLEKEVTRLKDELKRKEKELAEKDQDIKQLERKVSTLEQSQKNKNARITNLINQLKDKKSEVQSTNRTNEELQKKLEQSEAKLSALERKNANLENDLKRILAEGSKDNHERQLAEQLTEAKEKNNTLTKELKQLSQEFNELKKRNENLEREIWQLKSGKSLADEMSEVTTKVATSTQTEVEYESRGIEASDHETTVPKTQDQGTNAGVDASSSTDQKKTKEMEVQTEEQVIDLYNKEGKYVRTELSDPNTVPAKATEKSTPLG